ncbi:hypothetical protein H6P81_015395 [Aristolochia fimbriata]|uniref:Plastid movement impaired 2 n=1 Tax=Aristolochia fimbriata TaxID=158543 RepID=A0AAV7E7I0_ARIFI|nr:hypothetical protein H6P81_015395 [Aristolochia fimbriata]
MGNSLGGRKTAKVMKLDGETIKFKVPVRVEEVVKDHPEHVLMDSDAVRHLGVRAKPMEGYQELKPRRLYFLVQLPKPAALLDHKAPRRVRSGVINMSAKDRLESLMLSRRSVSDLSLVTASTAAAAADGAGPGPLRVKMRLPRAQVAKLVEESKDAGEAAERIMELCAAKGEEAWDTAAAPPSRRRPELADGKCKPRQKMGVRFLPVNEGEVV